MSQTDHLIAVCDQFCAAAPISRSRLSTVLFSRGTRLDEIADGGDIGSRLLDRKLQWLSENWPANAVWPAGITRPTPKIEAAE
ncbi:hypothetical protein [Oricola indica]|jgi:hypothetical protein|uniref:hypothetical protein n=1 Tax=Oricola indica TaxID=2872591 RepID=UPI001CBB8653|nr:hypothetical protein [Oricola indica]